jgi:arabinogalactan oligomer/maltooligosaccharide transport system permease protein
MRQLQGRIHVKRMHALLTRKIHFPETALGAEARVVHQQLQARLTAQAFRDTGTGAYLADDGTRIEPGWMIGVGFKNFEKAFGEPTIRGPLLKVTAWTFGFAFLSVLTTFALGLFLAIVFNEPRMGGRRIYRTLMILPYAFPAFLSGLVWAGMFNPEFGYINQVLLGGADVDWVNDQWLARLSVLIVNLAGLPYMFLVSPAPSSRSPTS